MTTATSAVCLIHRNRWPRNLGELLQVLRFIRYTAICRSELVREAVCQAKRLANKLAPAGPVLQPRQPVQQRLILLWRADADAQELSDSFLFEVPHDHALLTQLRGNACCVVLRVAGEDEVGR